MRVSTKLKPAQALDCARRIGRGNDFHVVETIESKIGSDGFLIFGPAGNLDFTPKPTILDISWEGNDRRLRMQYMIKGRAKGLLLGSYEETHLPEKRFACVDGMDGFEFTADDNGSSFYFYKLPDENGIPEMSTSAWVSGIKTLHATRMTNLHIDGIISSVLEPLVPVS